MQRCVGETMLHEHLTEASVLFSGARPRLTRRYALRWPPRALSLLSLPHGAPPGGEAMAYAGEPIPSRRLILLLVIQRYDGGGSTALMYRCEHNDAFRGMGGGGIGGGKADTYMCHARNNTL